MLIIFLFTAIFGKFIYLQCIENEELVLLASEQWTRDVPLSGERGKIYDVNGMPLAENETVYTVYVRPNAVKEKEIVAKTLSVLFDLDYETLLRKIGGKVSEVTVKKNVSKEAVNVLRSANLDGIYIGQSNRRKYVYGDFLSNVLGFTDIDGQGQTGIEKDYNRYLTGTDGKILTETDLVGRELTNSERYYIAGKAGNNVYLTVNVAIQKAVDEAVRAAYAEHQAKQASCIVMNPNTGAIVALAQYPSFDLNNVPRDKIAELLEMSKNTLIANVYEPGSTFKMLTASIGLENHTVSVATDVYCPGYRIVDGTRIRCWKTSGHGSQTFAKGVANSCNCLFMDTALGLGADKMYEGLEKFGVGQKTGIDISGEGKGLTIEKSKVKNVDLARIGFGQAVAVTAVELITACAAVVNGGELLTPYIVDRIVGENGEVYTGTKKVRGTAISAQTSAIMREILEGVVKEGGGKNAAVAGYRIGGKTGTAQKYGGNGKIAQGKYVATFVGFAPADRPEYILLFIVDEPSAGAYYGSVVAAPYASKIFSSIFAETNMKPTDWKEPISLVMPNVLGKTEEEAAAVMAENGLYYETYGEGIVSYQLPAPGSEIDADAVVYLALE